LTKYVNIIIANRAITEHQRHASNCVSFFMPKALERKLKAQARKKGLSKKRLGAYVYGTLRKTGWRPKKKRRKK